MVGIAFRLEPNFWSAPITDGNIGYPDHFNLDVISLQLINYAKSLTSAAIPTIMQNAISRQELYSFDRYAQDSRQAGTTKKGNKVSLGAEKLI
jgi:hypothetical protein